MCKFVISGKYDTFVKSVCTKVSQPPKGKPKGGAKIETSPAPQIVAAVVAIKFVMTTKSHQPTWTIRWQLRSSLNKIVVWRLQKANRCLIYEAELTSINKISSEQCALEGKAFCKVLLKICCDGPKRYLSSVSCRLLAYDFQICSRSDWLLLVKFGFRCHKDEASEPAAKLLAVKEIRSKEKDIER